jgi:hypothetical protein
VIRVLVGVEHPVHLPDGGSEELQAKLRGSIDQEPAPAGLDDRGGPGSAIARIV